ncbi:pantetheine-phosphate adenylyltransferase [Peptoniphilus sp. GNH]|nr:pantetheine-phosphate adenylyltransferase [Clostridiales bacterium KA00134]UHR02995.1 pantetheine-phosphate adenylyltransferase [Peptoniphilus sp. GNH]
MKVIYAGSFDPITNGHLDIILRARDVFGEVIVAVLNNVNKKSLFTAEQRVDMIKEVLKDQKNIEVDSFTGLLVDYAKKRNIKVVVRGLRTASDFFSEYNTAIANMHLEKGIETVFLPASEMHLFISSSLAKEVAAFNGDLEPFVPKIVRDAMKDKYNRR